MSNEQDTPLVLALDDASATLPGNGAATECLSARQRVTVDGDVGTVTVFI